jgi:rod shape-determining protein MreD
MQNKVYAYWLIAILLQIFLFNNLQFHGLCQPQVYILCLLAMPIILPHWADMLIGFAVGLLMDILCNSIGVHTAACVLLMYVRKPLIAAFVQEHERLTGEISWLTVSHDAFIKYIVVLIFIHQVTVSMLTAWSFHHFGMTILQIIISAGLNIGLILGYNIIRK